MKKEDLFRALSDIDEQFILEAAPDESAETAKEGHPVIFRRFVRMVGLAAAAFVFVFGLYVFRQGKAARQPESIQTIRPETVSGEPDAIVPGEPDAIVPGEPEMSGYLAEYDEDLDDNSHQDLPENQYVLKEQEAGQEPEKETEKETEIETEAVSEAETETENPEK